MAHHRLTTTIAKRYGRRLPIIPSVTQEMREMANSRSTATIAHQKKNTRVAAATIAQSFFKV